MNDFSNSDEWISNRALSQFIYSKRPPIRKNIVLRLFDRQYHFTPRTHSFVINNKFHQNLIPNFSVENVERPTCYLRKFTHDGRYLIAFSADITSVLVFEYQGPAAAAHLLVDVPPGQDNLRYRGDEHNEIRKNIFDCFFKQLHSIKITNTFEQLNRECSVFIENNRFMIVAAQALTNEDSSTYHERYQNNESLSASGRMLMEDYSFYLVDFIDGKVIDKICFKTDKIYIAYNHGIYLYKNIFAILSVLHQTIYLYYIKDSGHFVLTRKIGRFCHEDDEFLSSYPQIFNRRVSLNQKPVSAFREVFFTSLKHRLLTFAFWKAKHESEDSYSPAPLREFFRWIGLYVNLRMWKMQLIDEDHLLIKYEQESVLSKQSDFSNHQKSWNMFVVYNWKTTQVLNIYQQNSKELLNLYEQYCDYFRHPPSYFCSPFNNYYAKRAYKDVKRQIMDSRNARGHQSEAVKNILAALPHNAQSLTPSPYLDVSLFCYDEKMICPHEKPRYTSDVPIRFYDRNTGRFLFRLHTGQMFIPSAAAASSRQNSMMPYRRMAAFIFHPSNPFLITVQRYNSHYLVHLHFRYNPQCE